MLIIDIERSYSYLPITLNHLQISIHMQIFIAHLSIYTIAWSSHSYHASMYYQYLSDEDHEDHFYVYYICPSTHLKVNKKFSLAVDDLKLSSDLSNCFCRVSSFWVKMDSNLSSLLLDYKIIYIQCITCISLPQILTWTLYIIHRNSLNMNTKLLLQSNNKSWKSTFFRYG